MSKKIGVLLLVVAFFAGLGGWKLGRWYPAAPLIINTSPKDLIDLSLNGKAIGSARVLWAYGSEQVDIDTVGTQIPLTFKVGGKSITVPVNLRDAPTEDSSIVAIIIAPDFKVTVIKGMV